MNEKIETIYFFCDSTCCGIFLLEGITRGVFMALGKGYFRGYIVLRLFFFFKAINQISMKTVICI